MTEQNNNASIPQTLPPPLAPSLDQGGAEEFNPVLNARPRQSWEQLRRFLACNPFYLTSAALLLYSFYLVAGDGNFLRTDISRLAFNLSSLQVYEILVVVTAVWLARRAVWYDSTLLAGLENLLLLVPFILLSEAALIDARLVWFLSAGAGFIAVVRLSAVRRFIRPLNFPPRLLAMGTLLLVVNAALPVIYRVLHQSKVGTQPDFGAAYETNQYVWWLVLPAICALINAVPLSPGGTKEIWPQRRWLPLGLFSLWLAGTGVHLYSLTYVYDFLLRPDLVAPALWILLWVLWLRTSRAFPELRPAWRNLLWLAPMLATLLATSQPQKGVFLTLTLINLVSYGLLYGRYRMALALHLALISAVALLAGLPEGWGRLITADFSREKFVAGAAAVYALVCISLQPKPRLGLLGALLVAFVVGNCAPAGSETMHWVLQASLVYVLLHSIRWIDSEEQGTALLRWLAALGWLSHSVAWIHWQGAGWRASAVALAVLIVFFAMRWFRARPGPLAVWASALLVLLAVPGDFAATHMRSAPAGLLAVAGSFILFALGTLGALTKHRWGAPQTPKSASR